MKHELLNALIEDLKDIYWRIVRFTKTIPIPEHHIRRPIFLIIITLALLPLLMFLLLIGLSEISIIAWKYIYVDFIFSFLIVQCIMVLIATNPIYALLLLISVFFSSAILLLSFQVQFLALIYLIIYIGAIAILFLFVLMMFNIKHNKTQNEDPMDIFFISFFVYNVIAARFIYFVVKSIEWYVDYNLYFNNYVAIKIDDARYTLTYVYSDIHIFSNLLYTYYDFLFLLSGLLLFVAMIGSIILALSTTEINLFNLSKK